MTRALTIAAGLVGLPAVAYYGLVSSEVIEHEWAEHRALEESKRAEKEVSAAEVRARSASAEAEAREEAVAVAGKHVTLLGIKVAELEKELVKAAELRDQALSAVAEEEARAVEARTAFIKAQDHIQELRATSLAAQEKAFASHEKIVETSRYYNPLNHPKVKALLGKNGDRKER